MKNSTPAVMQPTPCPTCGGPLELACGIWAREVVIAPMPSDVDTAGQYTDGQIVDCAPSPVSDLPDGINVADEFRVTCADCGHELDVHHGGIPTRWTYAAPADDEATAAAIDRALRPIAEVLAWAREHHEQQGAALPGTWWVPEALEAAHAAVAALRPADHDTEV